MCCWFLFLSVLRCFTSRGSRPYHAVRTSDEIGEVSPFGYLRIEACSSAPRNFSQTCCVLHRSLESRHPPYTLQTSARKFENHITIDCSCERSLLRKYLSIFPVYARCSLYDVLFDCQRTDSRGNKKGRFSRPTTESITLARYCRIVPLKFLLINRLRSICAEDRKVKQIKGFLPFQGSQKMKTA